MSITDLVALGGAALTVLRIVGPIVAPYLVDGIEALRSLSA